MAKRNSPTEEGDVSESTSAAYCLLSYVDDVVVPAPIRRDIAETSEGDDVLEIEYQPDRGLEEASEDHSPEEARGHETRRGWSTHVKDQKCTRATVRPFNSHSFHSKSSTSPRRGRNIR